MELRTIELLRRVPSLSVYLTINRSTPPSRSRPVVPLVENRRSDGLCLVDLVRFSPPLCVDSLADSMSASQTSRESMECVAVGFTGNFEMQQYTNFIATSLRAARELLEVEYDARQHLVKMRSLYRRSITMSK